MPFPLFCWKLHTHFFYNPVFSVCKVFISSRFSAVRDYSHARWRRSQDASNFG